MSRHPDSAASSHQAPALPPLREEGGPVVTLAFVGLAVYLWVIHSYRLPIGTWGIVVGLFGLLLSQYRIRVPTPLLWFGGFILWGAITAPFAVHTSTTVDALENYLKLWLIALVSANVAHTRRQLYVLIVTWLGLFALYPLRGTFYNFLSGITHFGRTAWNFSFANPNDLASLTLPMLALAVMMLQSDRAAKWVRLSALAGVILLPLLIVVTQSRGGILALGTMGLLILAEYRRQARGIAIAALSAGVLLLVAPPESWQRLGGLTSVRSDQGLGAVDEEGSADQRFEIWRVAMAIARDHPVAGVGLGNYAEAHAQYASSTQFRPTARGRRDTHSIYLNALAETGLVGAGLLMMMFISALVLAVRRARLTARENPAAARQLKTLAIGLIAIMQAGIFGTLHGVAFLYIYIGILGAAGMILGAESAPAHLAGRRGASEGIRRPRGRSDRLAPESGLPDLAFHHAGQATGRKTV